MKRDFNIYIQFDSYSSWQLPLAVFELQTALRAMLEFVAVTYDLPQDTEIELALIDEIKMAELNFSYLHCSGPTNILAFPAPVMWSGQSKALGWLALCVPVVLREALLYGQLPGIHALRLLAHGLGHLLGHEHSEEMDMFAEQSVQAALSKLNAAGWETC